MFSRDLRSDPKKLVGCGAALTLGFAAVLSIAAVTPRARLNVMQAVSVVFLTTVAWRFRASQGQIVNPESNDSSEWGLLAVATVLGTLVWATMLNFYFVGDDFGILAVAQAPLFSQVKSVFLHGDGAGVFYRPLTFTSYFLDHTVWGAIPVGYHLTNLVLHLVTIAGLFAFCRQLGISRQSAAITAGVFASMPIHVEAVAWMSGRFDVLSTAIIVWAATCYVWSRRKNTIGSYSLVLLLTALSIFSKETGFVLPVLFAAIEMLVFRAKPGWKMAGYFALAGVMFAYRFSALGGLGGYKPGGSSSALDISTKTFEGLLIRSPSQMLTGFNWTQPGISVLIVASLLASLLLLAAICAEPGFSGWAIIKLALFWSVITVIPAHFLSVIGAGLSNSRILYLPSVGIAMMLGQVLGALKGPELRRTASVLLFALFSLGLLHNLAAWRWTSQLVRRTLDVVTQTEPLPAPQTQFVFSNLPDTVRGVFFFTTLSESLQMAYRRQDITAVRDSDIQISPNTLNARPQIRLYWKGETSGLLLRRDSP